MCVNLIMLWRLPTKNNVSIATGSNSNKQVIRDALAMWQDSTCLTFVERDEDDNNVTQYAANYLVFGQFGSAYG